MLRESLSRDCRSRDRKSTRLNSSHSQISYAVFCLKKKNFVHDIGTVEDSADTQTGYALVNGRRTVYIPVTKHADASTLSVVNLVKQNLGKLQSVLPAGVKVGYEFDQSPYVTRAIRGLSIEGLLGALLTGLMVLIFLRDWRSALVVVLNIPLAIAAALLELWLYGKTV